jgi:hypothetical protein
MTSASISNARDRRWLILSVIGVAQLMVILDLTVMNIALPSTYGFLAAGAALLAAFALWQGRAAHPLLPPRVVPDRRRWDTRRLSPVLLFCRGAAVSSCWPICPRSC